MIIETLFLKCAYSEEEYQKELDKLAETQKKVIQSETEIESLKRDIRGIRKMLDKKYEELTERIKNVTARGETRAVKCSIVYNRPSAGKKFAEQLYNHPHWPFDICHECLDWVNAPHIKALEKWQCKQFRAVWAGVDEPNCLTKFYFKTPKNGWGNPIFMPGSVFKERTEAYNFYEKLTLAGYIGEKVDLKFIPAEDRDAGR